MTWTGLQCLTADKVEATLTVALQYQYPKEIIVPIIMKRFDTEKQYLQFARDNMESVIIRTCALLPSEEFYSNRSDIEASLDAHVVESITDSGIGLIVQLLQLTNIDFPSSFADVIKQKQIVQQQEIQQLNNRATAITAATTLLLTAQQQAAQKIINADLIANITLRQAIVQEQVIQMYWIETGTALAEVKSSLNLSDNGIVQYLAYQTVGTSTNPVINMQEMM